MSLNNNLGSQPFKDSVGWGVSDTEIHRNILDACREEAPNREPYVRYGFPKDDDHPRQSPRLYHLTDEAVPAEANEVSPVYLLDEAQASRNNFGESPFAVEDDSCIATLLQNECEARGNVIYPIYIESDEADEVGLYEARENVKQCAMEVFDADLSACTAGFSGNRSPHLHLPEYVTSEEALRHVKEAVEEWCAAEGIELDTSIYTPKSLFRMWGGEHRNTGNPKLPIPIDSTPKELRKSLAAHLNGPPSTVERREEYDWGRVPGIASESSIFEGRSNTPLKRDVPLIERRERPTAESELELWKRYNRHPFTPYTNAHLERSVAVVRVKGTPFCRIDDDSERAKVPVYVYAAVGGDGEFRITKENAPLELSPPDYRKWEYEYGDTLVVMGAGNGRSKFFDVDAVERSMVVGAVYHDIHRPDNNRLSLDLLSGFGYDVGERGTIESNYDSAPDADYSSSAARLQADAERRHPSDLTHMNRRKVANSLLQRRGWDGAWEWFKTQYGDDFDPALTHDQFTSIIEEDAFDHVREFDIPPEP